MAATDAERQQGWDPMAPAYMTLYNTIHIKVGTAVVNVIMWVWVAMMAALCLTWGALPMEMHSRNPFYQPDPGYYVSYFGVLVVVILSIGCLASMSHGLKTEQAAFFLPIIILMVVEAVAQGICIIAVFIIYLTKRNALMAFGWLGTYGLMEGMHMWFLVTIIKCYKFFRDLADHNLASAMNLSEAAVTATAPATGGEKVPFIGSITIPGHVAPPPPYPYPVHH